MSIDKDPILEALARIEAKQDLSLQNQEQMEADIQQISQDTQKTAAIVGAVSGAVSGGIVFTGIALFRAKLGL
ncbi:hypothetical protein [Kingella kingae]|uniref:hypothetical protein n=1 Tax=Kingella kingae TaxID=504 RepID=UPI00254B74F7|nr:hypothetical protein [Kingella kingae]MDK4535807.1 hypothetical protein [Kingella kingae]MDK4539663.1 hypothetical protein [Kingella kingae]MDK4547580.1 hypothetical protein [Kingella kingae]MDK4623421.1 hypothetical protein [Kingella kingae]